jgi:hypothetical protein
VTSHSGKPIKAKVTLHTRSFDGKESTNATASAAIEPGKTADVPLSLPLNRNGWHELKITVEAAGERRETTLSLVMLPPNTRTYGNAPNETRFGLWSLLGHYTPMQWVDPVHTDVNGPLLEMLRKIGMRRVDLHNGFFDADLLKKFNFLAKAPHTIVNILFKLNEIDPEQMKKAVDDELKQIERIKDFPNPPYLYGGEWGIQPGRPIFPLAALYRRRRPRSDRAGKDHCHPPYQDLVRHRQGDARKIPAGEAVPAMGLAAGHLCLPARRFPEGTGRRLRHG